MGWLDNEDDEHGGSEHQGGKRRQQFEQDEDRNGYRQKRSGKRFHRRKTIKDGSWPGEGERISPKRK
jgi:hypothetical protein